MKNRIGVIVLAVVALALGVALFMVMQKSAQQQDAASQHIIQLSNTVVKTETQLSEQVQVTTNLYKDLDEQKKAYAAVSNSLVAVAKDLAQTTTNLAKTEENLKATQAEVAKRDARISELEARNQELDKQAFELQTAITNLNTQIAETQRKLTAAEGDKAFLQKELKRLMSDKAELERQFNDITVLRAQISKVKQELLAAKRAQWARDGMLYNPERKGGQLLMQKPGESKKAPVPSSDLNAEIHSEGPVKIIPPTNAPKFSPVNP
jgi:chromosome segregation ATPase